MTQQTMSIRRHVKLNDYRCSGLTVQQSQFLQKIVVLSQYVRDLIVLKCREGQPPIWTKHGIFPSLLIAWSIRDTHWGTSHLSQPRVPQPAEIRKLGWSHGNNLFNLRSDQYWEQYCDVVHLGGNKYKSFREWEACAIHLSDLVTWKSTYQDILACETLETQVELIQIKHKKKDRWRRKVLDLIERFDLQGFDAYG